MLWVILISVLFFSPFVVAAFLRQNAVPLLTFLILGLTLIVLLVYTWDTHRIAQQTVEANLKPIVLRSGYIPSWESLSFSTEGDAIRGTPMQFSIWKNIAMDIHGYIILNGEKYTLVFGSQQISQIASSQPSSTNSTSSIITTAFDPTWSWIAPNNTLQALGVQPSPFAGDNGIYIEYKDTEGNSYFTREDKDFHSIIGNL